MATTQSHVRGLQRIWVPEHSTWVFVWCADDGDLDRNHRLCYACVSTPAEFFPQRGQYILVDKPADESGDFVFCYGVPYAIEAVHGAIKVYYTDLTPALGGPRFTSDEATKEEAPSGKSQAAFGFCLEGQFSQGDLTVGPILWNLKDQTLHNNVAPVLEVADITRTTPTGAPTGCILVEYVRDATGRITLDADTGIPQIAQIEETGDRVGSAQNYKIGYLALTFVPDHFGPGLHAWVGSSAATKCPFDAVALNSTDQTFQMRPGAVNQLVPANFADALSIANDTSYVYVRCETDGKQVNAATIEVDSTPRPPPTATMGAAPAEFNVLLWVILRTAVDTTHTFKSYKVWGCGNISATPTEFLRTDKATSPDPGQLPQDVWYSWQAVLG